MSLSKHLPSLALLAALALAAGPVAAADPAPVKPAPAAPATPAKPDPNAALDACSKLAETNPDEALAKAKSWEEQAGGDPAKLCRGLALFHKRQYKAAAEIFVGLANGVRQADPKAAAALLARAGWAAMRDGDDATADHFYTEALSLTADDPDLHIDRAFARAEAQRFDDAVSDLDAAIAEAPTRADAYLYRAAAHKARKDWAHAKEDVAKSLALKPGDPEALLLRGNLRAATDDLDGAESDWNAVLAVSPQSNQGKAARANLDRLAAALKANKEDAPEPDSPLPAKTPAK